MPGCHMLVSLIRLERRACLAADWQMTRALRTDIRVGLLSAPSPRLGLAADLIHPPRCPRNLFARLALSNRGSQALQSIIGCRFLLVRETFHDARSCGTSRPISPSTRETRSSCIATSLRWLPSTCERAKAPIALIPCSSVLDHMLAWVHLSVQDAEDRQCVIRVSVVDHVLANAKGSQITRNCVPLAADERVFAQCQQCLVQRFLVGVPRALSPLFAGVEKDGAHIPLCNRIENKRSPTGRHQGQALPRADTSRRPRG